MQTIKLKPRKGIRVLDPATRKPLPERGEKVTLTTYWRRRLRDGDVEQPQPPRKQEK